MLELKTLKHIVMGTAFTLAVPGLALAEGAGQRDGNDRNDRIQQNENDQRQQQQRNAEGTQARQQQQQQQQQQVRGTVESVEVEEGKLTIRDAERDESVELRAKPQQIGQVREGQRVTARYGEYNGDRWLLENMQPGAHPQLGRPQTSQGQITEISRDDGQLTVRTADDQEMELRAHPAEVQELQTGQLVNVEYQNVGEDAWVTQIQRMRAPEGAPGNDQPRNGNGNDSNHDRNQNQNRNQQQRQ